MDIKTVLIAFSGLAWTLVYMEAIRIGIRQKTYAMPYWALALNIAWELLHAIYGYRAFGFVLQVVINIIWFLLDCGILYTYLRYSAASFPEQINSTLRLLWNGGVILIALILQYLFIMQFPLLVAASYSAFLQNLLMSVLFIAMLGRRGSSRGQSQIIAYGKFLGTLAPTILLGVIGFDFLGGPSPFILSIGIIIAMLDISYIFLLKRVRSREHN